MSNEVSQFSQKVVEQLVSVTTAFFNKFFVARKRHELGHSYRQPFSADWMALENRHHKIDHLANGQAALGSCTDVIETAWNEGGLEQVCKCCDGPVSCDQVDGRIRPAGCDGNHILRE